MVRPILPFSACRRLRFRCLPLLPHRRPSNRRSLVEVHRRQVLPPPLQNPFPTLLLGQQFLVDSYPLGKSLVDTDLTHLASKGAKKNAINVVLTANDITVDGFCMNRCGTHGASPPSKAGRFTYIWVGNSATQCPGQCAWPFHQPIYGPQGLALVAPNGDVGVDGMVINLASMVAGAVTNPFGNGFYQSPKGAPLKAATACSGVYGTGVYPGYAGG